MDLLTILVAANGVLLLGLVIVLVRNRPRAPPADLSNQIALAVDSRLLAFQTAIQESVTAARQEVAKSNETLQTNATAFHKSVGDLGKTIGELVTQQKGATELAQDLKSLLESPKLRGNYGEEVLEEMLRRVLPEGVWESQYVIDGREKVDAVVKFREIVFPIDAKFPRDDYERYLEAKGDDEKRRCWRDYEGAIKTQIDSISEKYVKPDKGTADFALMFIPSEGVYYETIADANALGSPNPILAYAQSRHVIPVSPNTLYAFLQVIVIATRNVKLLQNAKKLQEGLAEVQGSFDKFFERFQDVGENLVKAAKSYNVGEGHVNRFKERVDKVLALEFGTDEPKEKSPVLAARVAAVANRK